MPLTTESRHALTRLLDDEYMRIHDLHYKAAPRNADGLGSGIPVGGGDWMDTFFKMEAIRGVISELRQGKDIDTATATGKVLSEIAIRIWNGRREYQVRRWEQCCHDFIERLVWRLLEGV